MIRRSDSWAGRRSLGVCFVLYLAGLLLILSVPAQGDSMSSSEGSGASSSLEGSLVIPGSGKEGGS
jgi:hypothetical protein